MDIILKTDDSLSSMQSMFLLALFNSEPLSGTEIVDKLKKDIGPEWVPSTGARYKILSYLEDNGYLKISENKEKLKKNGEKDERFTFYEITDLGKKKVEEITSKMKKLYLFITDCCPEYTSDIKIVRKCDEC